MTNILTLLQEMNVEQKQALVKILGLKKTDDQEIALKISKILLPAKGWLQEPMTYKQFIISIAEKNNETADFSKGIVYAERELYLKLFQNEFEKLSQEEKDKFLDVLDKAGLNKNQIASLSGIGALGAAQLSGFGIYVLASSTVGAITSLLGITLPFALYTGMSSAISFIIGPVGFLVMGVLIYRSFKHVKTWAQAVEILDASWKEMGKLVRGDFSSGTQIFKYIAASRIILEKNFSNEIEGNKEKLKLIGEEFFFNEKIHSNNELEISTSNENINILRFDENNLKMQIQQIEKQIDDIRKNIITSCNQLDILKDNQSTLHEENLRLKIKNENVNFLISDLNQKIKNITQ